MAHPSYSPDLASSDLWLFNCLEYNLDTYPDSTKMAKKIAKELNSIPTEEYQKSFRK